jgi:hypothetical protein
MVSSFFNNPFHGHFAFGATTRASNTQNPFKMCFMNCIQQLPKQIPEISIKSAIGTFAVSILFGSTVSSAAILASVAALATVVDAFIHPVLAEIVDQNSLVGTLIRGSLTYTVMESILTSIAPFTVIERTLTRSLTAIALKTYILISQSPTDQNTAKIYLL